MEGNTDKFSLSFHQPAALRKINARKDSKEEAFKESLRVSERASGERERKWHKKLGKGMASERIFYLGGLISRNP